MLLAGIFVLLLYGYLGYPLLAGLLAVVAGGALRRVGPRADGGEREEAALPTVSLVILAYNEERDLAGKLENSLALDYPKDKLEVWVASDGSTDGTDEIARGFAGRGVRLFRADEHPGKTGTTNRVVEHTTGEVLVFSDATGQYGADAIRKLVRNFADPRVGAVTGRVVYDYDERPAAQGFRAYQRWVVFARQAESVWGTETSVSGSICAIRRELFQPIPEHLDFDMAHPLHVALAGRRTVYEAEATSNEEARTEARSEFAARVRMAIFAYSFLPYLVERLPRCRRGTYAFQVLSHKVLRWVSPFLLMGLLLASGVAVAGGSAAAAVLLAGQLAVYGGAAWAFLRPASPVARALGPALFFVTIHLAFAVGFVRFARGERIGGWTTERGA